MLKNKQKWKWKRWPTRIAIYIVDGQVNKVKDEVTKEVKDMIGNDRSELVAVLTWVQVEVIVNNLSGRLSWLTVEPGREADKVFEVAKLNFY